MLHLCADKGKPFNFHLFGADQCTEETKDVQGCVRSEAVSDCASLSLSV